jgi:hypothetical protein
VFSAKDTKTVLYASRQNFGNSKKNEKYILRRTEAIIASGKGHLELLRGVYLPSHFGLLKLG